MTFALATDADSRVTDWHGVDWRRALRYVRRLQVRIVKAVKQGKWRLVKALQRLLNHSVSGRLLAVRRVTENRGKKTPGVDGILWDTPEKKMKAVERLQQKHEWMLENIPMQKRMLKKWLKAGYIEENAFHHTEKGTPQGGIASPLLANMCLDGLEACVVDSRTEKHRHKVNVVRYADDFIITGDSEEWLEQVAKPRVIGFLAERG